MSRSQVVYRRRFVCDEIIYYTMTCSIVYPATVLGKFRRGCLLKSDMSSGELASSCRGRQSIGNLQGHTPCALDWVPWVPLDWVPWDPWVPQGHTPCALDRGHMPCALDCSCHVETNCKIQDHHISDSSQIFSGCSFRCTCLFQAAHVMLVREISATVRTVRMSVCVRHAPQPCALWFPEHYYIIQASS